MKWFTYIIFYYALSISIAYTMDTPHQKRTSTLLWLADNLIIFTSKNNCSIKNPFVAHSNLQLHDQLPHHIILNQNKTKAGLFCQESFVVYDIPTREKLWSLSIPYNDNYSATFSSTDEIIMYHKEHATMNGKWLNLPFIEPDATFEISCNYQTKEIIYPSSNNTFTRKSLIDDHFVRHTRLITDNGKKYRVCSAFYNPYGHHIALHTEEKRITHDTQQTQKIFLLNSRTHTISKVLLKYKTEKKEEEEESYHCAQFLPHSSLIAVLCPHRGIHFWDFIQQQEVWVEALEPSKGKCKNNSTTFAVDPNSLHYTAIIQRNYFMNTIPQHVLRDSAKKHISFVYWFLCHYVHDNNLLPADIVRILICYLHLIYKISPTALAFTL